MSGRALLALGGIAPTSKPGKAILAGLALPDPDPIAREAVVEIADQFLRAGGSWSRVWWSKLSPLERSVCVEAGERADTRRAQRLAVLISLARDVKKAADLAAEFDGGAMREEVAVDDALLRAERSAAALVQSGG